MHRNYNNIITVPRGIKAEDVMNIHESREGLTFIKDEGL